MSDTKEISYNGNLIGLYINLNNFEQNSFPTPEDQSFQLGLWSIKNKKIYEKHIHKDLSRNIKNTSEFLFVLKGSLTIKLFSEDNHFVDTIVLGPNESFLQFMGGHEIIAESETKFFEIKQGPYLGKEADKFIVK